MEVLISIVVPIYKVEKYLKKCVDSIIRQTYKNIEIILVDDGSPDNCGQICEDYAKVENRVRVIHKENGGLSDARNAGIDIAKGKYICFIDSDDYVDVRYIELLYNAIKNNGTKLAQCNIKYIDEEDKEIKNIGYVENEIIENKRIIKEQYGEHNIENIVVWNKMYSIDLFENIRFPVGKINEDEFTTYKILYSIDKVSIVSEYLYLYRQNQNSIMSKKFNIKRLDLIEAMEERKNFFLQKNEVELYELTLNKYMDILKEYFIRVKLYISNSDDITKNILKKYRKEFGNYIWVKNVTLKKKIKGIFFLMFPNLFFNMKKKYYEA